MLGGAHIVASNHVFNTARPDGLHASRPQPIIAIAQLIKVEGVRFDVRKFEWLGSSGLGRRGPHHPLDLPYKTFEELRKADRELVVGTTGPAQRATTFPCCSKNLPACN